MLRVLALLVSLTVLGGAAFARDPATLKAADGLSISADIYRATAGADAPGSSLPIRPVRAGVNIEPSRHV